MCSLWQKWVDCNGSSESDFPISSKCKSSFFLWAFPDNPGSFELIYGFENTIRKHASAFTDLHLNPKLPPLTPVQKSRIQFWLFEQKDMRIEGRIIVSPLFSLEFCRICQAYSEDLLAQIFHIQGFRIRFGLTQCWVLTGIWWVHEPCSGWGWGNLLEEEDTQTFRWFQLQTTTQIFVI
jgi:hypothetical protein